MEQNQNNFVETLTQFQEEIPDKVILHFTVQRVAFIVFCSFRFTSLFL